ncbi:unnamed protein product, partial [Amoebophrya sp. A25]|eukprot:GSA25T00012113001.1
MLSVLGNWEKSNPKLEVGELGGSAEQGVEDVVQDNHAIDENEVGDYEVQQVVEERDEQVGCNKSD